MPKRGDRNETSGAAAAPRPCAACGADVRFSHREYSGGGASRVVLRCRGCGAVTSHAAAAGDDDKARMRSRKPPVDEGPPRNTVLDPEMARRLLDSMGGNDSGPA